ncbi:Rho GTPase activation protein, partial [Piptocephalis cylindrospora]
PTSRIVFGRTLEEAIAVASVRPDYPCPAVVYRCIQYLEEKQAELEEGIYRLSGSSSYHDVHAVAGLLKLYLRELPQSVLTPQLHVDFLRVL